jgi:hypothetical protein
MYKYTTQRTKTYNSRCNSGNAVYNRPNPFSKGLWINSNHRTQNCFRHVSEHEEQCPQDIDRSCPGLKRPHPPDITTDNRGHSKMPAKLFVGSADASSREKPVGESPRQEKKLHRVQIPNSHNQHVSQRQRQQQKKHKPFHQ